MNFVLKSALYLNKCGFGVLKMINYHTDTEDADT